MLKIYMQENVNCEPYFYHISEFTEILAQKNKI